MVKKSSTFFYHLIKGILKPIFIFLFHPKYKGRENIPASGGVIVAGNHTSMFDPCNLCISTRRQVHYLAKEFLFHYRIVGPLFGLVGCIPVYKESSNSGSLDEAIRQLINGRIIGIFPEGGIKTSDEILDPFKPGAAVMAKKANVPIVPMVIKGTYKTFKNDLRVIFGEPLNISDLSVEEITECLRNKMIEMLNDETL